jgi:hypothetical protein
MSKKTTDISREEMSWKLFIQNTWKSTYYIGHLEAISGEDRGKQEMTNYCIRSDIKVYVKLMNYEILYVCRESLYTRKSCLSFHSQDLW